MMWLTIFVLSILYLDVVWTEFTHDRKRVGPLNLMMAEHTCLQKFTVSESTIIRTQDSRILGAKFINESDVGNREDCLSLCCNTALCDVAVFQEKSPFSCYLFDCGPPEDFLCKFTGHSSYTAAALTVNRHQLELGLWSSQHQHEAELHDLRSPLDDSKKFPNFGAEFPPTTTTTTTVTTTTTRPATTTRASPTVNTRLPPGESKQDERKCSRFQFECHSGECLAIYNACDGIPQCKDGSDESQDLGCPTQGGSDSDSPQLTKLFPSNQGQGNVPFWRTDQEPLQRKFGQEKGVENHQTGNINPLEYNKFGNGISPDYPREEGLGYGGHGKGPGYYDYNSRSPAQNRYAAGKKVGNLNVDSPPVPYPRDYPDYELINRARNRQQQFPSAAPDQRIPLAFQTNGQSKVYPESFQQRPELQVLQPWQQHGQGTFYHSMQLDPRESSNQFDQFRPQSQKQFSKTGDSLDGNYMKLDSQLPLDPRLVANQNSQSYPMQKPAEGVPANSAIPENDKQGLKMTGNPGSDVYSASNGAANRPLIVGAPQKANLTVSSKINETTSAVQTPITASKNPKVQDQISGPKTGLSSISVFEVDLKELAKEEEIQKSQTSGAVLALSLGICVASLMLVLVGCKIKGIKKRMRRRRGLRSPLETDSDYLVNGMYL